MEKVNKCKDVQIKYLPPASFFTKLDIVANISSYLPQDDEKLVRLLRQLLTSEFGVADLRMLEQLIIGHVGCSLSCLGEMLQAAGCKAEGLEDARHHHGEDLAGFWVGGRSGGSCSDIESDDITSRLARWREMRTEKDAQKVKRNANNKNIARSKIYKEFSKSLR